MLFKKSLIFTFIVSSMLLVLSICQAAPSSAEIKTMTIAEVFANKNSLKGKKIQVKGKVVKVSHNIMKLNWIHIKDGTGAEGSDKIIFRSEKETATVGSDVIAQGIVDIDLDFGYGYTYPILVNDAVFNK